MSAAYNAPLLTELFGLVQFMCSVEKGTAFTEAQMKMQIADSIFDDLIGDTASMLLDMLGEDKSTE